MIDVSDFFVNPLFAGVPLTLGKFALVDSVDWPTVEVASYKWYALHKKGNPYAARAERQDDGSYKTVYMARQIAGEPVGAFVDHRNGSTLDNRRDNLRVATSAQNTRNRRKPRMGASSQYKGVCWKRPNNRWCARITVDGRRIGLGFFSDEVSAAKAYDAAALLHHGEFARTNFGGLAA